jgi:hypothetical protein
MIKKSLVFLLFFISQFQCSFLLYPANFLSAFTQTWSSEYVTQSQQNSTVVTKDSNKSVYFSFPNGFSNSIDEYQSLSKIFGGEGLPINFFHQITSSAWVKSATKAGVDLVMKSSDIVMAKNLTSYFGFLSQTGNYFNIFTQSWFPSSEYIPQRKQLDMATTMDLNKSVAISFVNGIYHSLEECQNISKILGDSFYGLNVHLFYNPTTGSWMKDATRAGFDLVLRSSDIVLAKELSLYFRSIFKELHPNGRIIHFAHSGGAILTYLAAKYHLTPDEISRIDIVTFGAGKSITKKYFHHSQVRNYYAMNDPCTLLDTRCKQLLKRYQRNLQKQKKELQKRISSSSSSSSSFSGSNNSSPAVIIHEEKHNTSFIFIHSMANHPIVDHSMFGPTYRYAINQESEFLKESLHRLILQDLKEKNKLRKVRKLSAKVTGFHHFWEKLSLSPFNFFFHSPPKQKEKQPSEEKKQLFVFPFSLLRIMRKSSARVTGFHGYFSRKYFMVSPSLVVVNESQSVSIHVDNATVHSKDIAEELDVTTTNFIRFLPIKLNLSLPSFSFSWPSITTTTSSSPSSSSSINVTASYELPAFLEFLDNIERRAAAVIEKEEEPSDLKNNTINYSTPNPTKVDDMSNSDIIVSQTSDDTDTVVLNTTASVNVMNFSSNTTATMIVGNQKDENNQQQNTITDQFWDAL